MPDTGPGPFVRGEPVALFRINGRPELNGALAKVIAGDADEEGLLVVRLQGGSGLDATGRRGNRKVRVHPKCMQPLLGLSASGSTLLALTRAHGNGPAIAAAAAAAPSVRSFSTSSMSRHSSQDNPTEEAMANAASSPADLGRKNLMSSYPRVLPSAEMSPKASKALRSSASAPATVGPTVGPTGVWQLGAFGVRQRGWAGH